MPASSYEELGRHVEALARSLRADEAATVMERVVAVVREAVGTADHVGLSVVQPPRPLRTLVGSSTVAAVDALQLSVGIGPGCETGAEESVARVADLAVETRWGGFGPAVAEQLGLRSLLVVRQRVRRHDTGVLGLWATRPDAFSDRDEELAVMLAPFAAVAMLGQLEEQRAEQLERALASSRTIGTAIGIVMSRDLVLEDQAFDRLVQASQHLNRKLRDVAATVVETGQVPQFGRPG